MDERINAAMSNFPKLDSLMHSHFHQDFDLIADTIKGLVADFKDTSTSEEIVNVREDIAKFLNLSDGEIESVFKESYGYDFDPALWDLTAKTFLQRLNKLLSQDS